LSQVLAQIIAGSGRSDALTLLEGYEIVEHITTVSRLIEETPAADRPRVLRVIDRASLHVWWNRVSTAPSAIEHEPSLDMIREIVAMRSPDLGPDRIRVSYVSPAPEARASAAGDAAGSALLGDEFRAILKDIATGRHFLIAVQLVDGSWLEFELPDIASLALLSRRFALAIAAMAAAVLLLSVWVVRRVLAPLHAFAQAAERLGVDVSAPPLEESGSREIRRVAQSFNRMQRRIRRLVDDRTQMAVAISHDLRTPITRLRLRAESIEDAETRRGVIANLEEMDRLIGAVLTFGADTAEGEPHEIADVARLLNELRTEFAELGGEVTVDAPESLPYPCRRGSLRRCLANLIANALRYGGRADVTLRRLESAVEVRVEDPGPGIPAEQRERVFRPFVRLACDDGAEAGVGLGLAMARTIARAHGGDIALHDRGAAPGLCAVVTLPIPSAG